MTYRDETTTELNCEQLVTLWNIADKPIDDDELAPMLSAASREAIVRFFTMLAETEQEAHAVSVASSSLTPPEVLEMLAQSVKRVRLEVAENPRTSAEVLTQLSKDDEEGVRGGVGRNPSTPVDVLIDLLDNDHWIVRSAVAENTSLPVEIMSTLVSDERRSVRWATAGNPSAPKEVLAQLAADEDEGVRAQAHANLEARS